jgi:hypothetical protein
VVALRYHRRAATQGLRLVDILIRSCPGRSDIFCRIRLTAGDRVSSNDVTIDDRGLIYLVDRIRGVDIIETTAFG